MAFDLKILAPTLSNLFVAKEYVGVRVQKETDYRTIFHIWHCCWLSSFCNLPTMFEFSTHKHNGIIYLERQSWVLWNTYLPKSSQMIEIESKCSLLSVTVLKILYWVFSLYSKLFLLFLGGFWVVTIFFFLLWVWLYLVKMGCNLQGDGVNQNPTYRQWLWMVETLLMVMLHYTKFKCKLVFRKRFYE